MLSSYVRIGGRIKTWAGVDGQFDAKHNVNELEISQKVKSSSLRHWLIKFSEDCILDGDW